MGKEQEKYEAWLKDQIEKYGLSDIRHTTSNNISRTDLSEEAIEELYAELNRMNEAPE